MTTEKNNVNYVCAADELIEPWLCFHLFRGLKPWANRYRMYSKFANFEP